MHVLPLESGSGFRGTWLRVHGRIRDRACSRVSIGARPHELAELEVASRALVTLVSGGELGW